MVVCKYCLEAIESHEGRQFSKKLDVFEDECITRENEENISIEVFCEWCEEYNDESEMYII